MANWGQTWIGHNGEVLVPSQPSYLGFWVAQRPWGKWIQVHEEIEWLPCNDSNACAYEPQIPPKWLAPDGKSFWLVWSDFQTRLISEEAREEGLQQEHEIQKLDVARHDWATYRLRRGLQPHYSFNVQRVDLIVG
jgi:hypothetical protein